jgi:glycine cleavage system H protein
LSQIPPHLAYTASHEWVRREPDGTVVVGITDHAQHALGDIVYVELPAPGRRLAMGETCVVVESVKAAADVYAPLPGTVVAVNEALSGAPERLNASPYGEGWLLRLAPEGDAALLDAQHYRATLDQDA